MKKIAVIGDCGIDYILIKHQNDFDREGSSPFLFLNWPQFNYITKLSFLTGAALVHDILRYYYHEYNDTDVKAVDRAFFPKKECKKDSINSFSWETYSQWSICENESDPNNKYWTRMNTYLGRGNSTNVNETTWNLLPGWTKSKIEKCQILSLYDNIHFNANAPVDQRWSTPYFNTTELSTIGFKCVETVVLRTRLHYKPEKSELCEPEIISDLEDKNIARDKIVLLINADELQRGGASLEKPVSWENIFCDLVREIESLKNPNAYKAIIVGLATHGALLYAKGNYTLFYYENEIGDLSSSNEKGLLGSFFGATSITQAFITLSLAKEEEGNIEKGLIESIKDGIERGLMASREVAENGFTITISQMAQSVQSRIEVRKPAPVLVPDSESLKFPYEIIKKEKYFNKKLSGFSAEKRPSQLDIPTKNTLLLESHIHDTDAITKCRVDSILKLILTSKDLKYMLKEEAYVPLTDNEELTTSMDRLSDRKEILYQSYLILTPQTRIYDFCKQIIRNGEIEPLYKDAHGNGKTAPPYLRIGKLFTYDRNEITQICDTYNVMKTYIRDRSRRAPLSICIFGRPGAGKSFSIKELVNFLDANPKGSQPVTEFQEFNVSQMESASDLAQALHKVRDIGLEEKMPVAFFDEFDCNYPGDDKRLGWLRFFLAPMQDGSFVEKGVQHRTGRAVFVFAGSGFSSMKDFIDMKYNHDENIACDQSKHIDFISRIKGYINVSGPNSQTNPPGILHYFRRATLLRTQLETKLKIDRNGYIGINDDVIYAFLNATKYRNESRSLEAILQMSDFKDERNIAASEIYQSNRLQLHLEGNGAVDEFLRNLRYVEQGR